jgi:hypothetical protein
MTTRSRSDPIPEYFKDAMGPLIRRHPGEFSDEDSRDYYAVLKVVHERWLKFVVAHLMVTRKKPWMPTPAVILELARRAQYDDWQRRVDAAPPCDVCQNSSTGSVDGILADGSVSKNLACICVRGERLRGRKRRAFDPSTMRTHRQVAAQKLLAGEQKRLTVQLPDLSVPPSTNKSQKQQLREIRAKAKDLMRKEPDD